MCPMTLPNKQWRRVLLMLVLLLAAWQLAGAGWIHAKAMLAQHLLARAWEHTREEGVPHKPWPWADTWPAARLQAPALGADYHVLAGTSGQALAFGPGLHEAFDGSAERWTVIAGHRDTHFRFLQALQPGMTLRLEDIAGRVRHFRVVAIRVVDSRVETLQPPASGADGLLLVTCYPFDSWQTNGPLRYVVEAQPSPAARRPVRDSGDG